MYRLIVASPSRRTTNRSWKGRGYITWHVLNFSPWTWTPLGDFHPPDPQYSFMTPNNPVRSTPLPDSTWQCVALWSAIWRHRTQDLVWKWRLTLLDAMLYSAGVKEPSATVCLARDVLTLIWSTVAVVHSQCLTVHLVTNCADVQTFVLLLSH